MGIGALALLMNPSAFGPLGQKAEEIISASQNAALASLCPFAAIPLLALDAITQNNGVNHPLFKPANDNSQGAPANDNAPVEYDLPYTWDQLMNIGSYVVENLDSEDPQLAVQALEKAAQTDAESGDIQLYLGKAYLAIGDGYAASSALSAHLENNPHDQDAVKLRMQAYQMDLNARLENPGPNEEIEELQLAILMDEAYLVNANFSDEVEGIEQLKIKFEDANLDSAEEGLAVLKGFEKSAERYLAMGDLPFEDIEAAEANRENMNALAAQTYDAAESVALCSPYEEVRARAPLYAALATLARGDIEGGQKSLGEIRETFPEAEAIVLQMEAHDRMALQLSIVDAWEKHVAKHSDIEEYAEDKALIAEVRRMMQAGEAETVKQAFEKVVEKDNDPNGDGYPTNIGGRAKHILENGHIAGTNGDYIIENFLFYTMQESINENGGRALLYQFDQYMSQTPDATEFPAAAFGVIKAMCDDEGIHKSIDAEIKVHSGDGSFGDYAFMAFREIMRGDLPAELGVAAAGTKIFKAVEGFAYARLIAKGWSARKAKVIAFSAGMGVEATGTWAMRTAPLLAIKNGEVSGDYLVKSYVANLIGNGSMRLAMGRGEKVAGLVKSPALKLLITHSFGLGGAVGGNKINQWRGYVPTPRGGFKQTFATDITNYFVFAVGGAIQEKYFPVASPAEPAKVESVKVEPAKIAPEPVLAAAKQAPAKPATKSQDLAITRKEKVSPDDVATGVKTVDKKVTDSEINKVAAANDAKINEAKKLAREQRLADGQYFLQTVHSTQLLGALRDPGVKARVAELAKRTDAIGEQARDFQKQAKACEDKLTEFQKMNTDYQRSPTPEKRTALDKFYENDVGKAMGDLKDTPHYKLHEAYERRANNAYLELKPVLFALKGPKVKFTPLEKLTLDPKDPIGSIEKMPSEDIVSVELPAAAKPAPAKPTPAKDPLLPKDALYGVSGPVGLYGLLTSQGVPQSVAILVSGAALAIPVIGMVWGGGSRPKPQPIVPSSNGLPVAIQDSPSSPARLVVAPTKNGGLILFDGPVGTPRGGVTVNGRPMTYEWMNGMTVKQGDIIEVDGRSYEIAPSHYRSEPAAAFQAGNQGQPAAPVVPPPPGKVVRTKNGDNTLMIAIEGSGRAPGQKAADAEAQAAMSDWIQQGYGLEQVVPGGRAHVQKDFVKDDGTVRGGAPKLDAAGVQLVSTPEGYEATFVRNGNVEAAVIRLGDAKDTIFQATEGKSSPEKPLRDGDVVVMGKFEEGLQSMWVVRDIVKKSGTQSADVIQAALVQEAAIRAELRKIVPADQVIQHKHYEQAYERVTGQKPQFGYAGYYEGGYVLKASGEVVSVRDGKPVDKFSATPMPFQVQVVGK